MEYHEVANIFPMMGEEEYQVLVEDIRINGLRKPIWCYEGKIIDGRNRWRAYQDLNITPRLREWDEKGSLIAFVVSLNLQRRHLTSSQKAVVAFAVEKHLAREARKQQGRRTDLLQKSAKSDQPLHAAQQAGAIVGTNRQYVLDAKRIHRNSPGLLAYVRDGSLTIPEAKKLNTLSQTQQQEVLARVDAGEVGNVKESVRQIRLAEQVQAVETMQLPKGTYHVIVVDPPWPYTKRREDNTHRGTLPYPTMTIEEIADTPVGSITYEDCILWLWTTNAFMEGACHIVRVWGFEAKTILTWSKDRMGLGDWLRGQTEHCLMAVRGKPVVTLSNQTTLLRGPVREHSRKPESFYRLVESLCPGRKCELFSRSKRSGWTTFGAEVEMFQEEE